MNGAIEYNSLFYEKLAGEELGPHAVERRLRGCLTSRRTGLS